jgi:hypothetical protein
MSGSNDDGAGDLCMIISRLDELRKDIAEIRERVNGTREFYTVEQFANCTGRAPFTVRRWIKNKLINAERVVGTGPKGRLLIPGSELGRILRSGRGDK